jgi:hypothetical protein
MKNLSHSASFESLDNDAPSKSGTKHLASLGFKQIPSPREVEAALALGEEAAVTNATEAVG